MKENKMSNKSEKEIIKENMLTLYKAHQEGEKNPIDENLKNTNPLKWTGLMNNYKHIAEEVILKELIYC